MARPRSERLSQLAGRGLGRPGRRCSRGLWLALSHVACTPIPHPHQGLEPASNQDSAGESVLQESEGQLIFHGGSLEGFLEEGTTWKQTSMLVGRNLPATQDLVFRRSVGSAWWSAWSQQELDVSSERSICGQRGATASSGGRRAQGGVQSTVRPRGQPAEVGSQPRVCPAGDAGLRASGNSGPERGSPHPHPEEA